MHALLYTSTARPELTDTELELILVKSRALNAVRGITGALLKRGERIVQYLEGEPAALERTFARILASPLHHQVTVVERAENVERVFDRWHMGFREFQPLHSRSTSTDDWERTLAGMREGAAANTPARRLLEQWDALGFPGR